MILCRRIVCERDSARAGADTVAGSSRLTACAPLARATQRRFGFQERRLAQAGGRWLFVQQLADARREGPRSPVLVVAQTVLGEVYLPDVVAGHDGRLTARASFRRPR